MFISGIVFFEFNATPFILQTDLVMARQKRESFSLFVYVSLLLMLGNSVLLHTVLLS